MTLYESPQVQQWRIEYAELRESFGTELSEFEFVAQKAAFHKLATRPKQEYQYIPDDGGNVWRHTGKCMVCGGFSHGYGSCPKLDPVSRC